jgi:DNA polymerase III delta prime subunit
MDDLLSQLAQKKTIPHALLLLNGEKRALTLAQQLVGSQRLHHPDIHHFYPEGKAGLHPIDNLRKLAEDVALAPFEAPYKVFLIHEAERMAPTSANALLKTFEEPAERTVILLITRHRDRILPTVLSRCQIYTCTPAEEPSPQVALLLEILAGQRDKISELETQMGSEEGAPYLEKAEALFETVLKWHRDSLAVQLGLPDTALFYPSYRPILQQMRRRPLQEVEKAVAEARLGVERALKFSLCLHHLLD